MRPRTTHWQELVTVAETAAGGSNMKGDEDQVQNPTPTLLSWRTALTISQDKTELPIGAEFEDVMRYLTGASTRCRFYGGAVLYGPFTRCTTSDPDVDVTTSVRHHPIEYVLASGVYWVAVIVLDISAVVALTHGLAVFRYGQHPA